MTPLNKIHSNSRAKFTRTAIHGADPCRKGARSRDEAPNLSQPTGLPQPTPGADVSGGFPKG